MSNLGLDLRLFSRQQKAVSDNSLKKISLGNLPHFLRSLSSQSTAHSDGHRAAANCQSHALYPARPIPYCCSEATIVNRSPDSSRMHVWSPHGGSLIDDDCSGDADVDEEEDEEMGEKAKVLVKRKVHHCAREDETKGQQLPLCVTNSTTSDDTPLIDREVKPAITHPR